ncbi:MAG: nucleotide exchange factor GrpE [Chloroflexi bacterium]|nr:nucleotide exchange factor GrpE [Chloroflexota bacterium]MCY3582102.1 nucleotide exchange factor GrpE [Chloroflexota bacterium]MCY3715548.1 nucleotide exchange factor GrpE [Chloroflexota bacterium]MDE2650714.1 nucleotide exchange factor GrpE [Chloroflexota bacterium]MXV92653.1 nucleotide exchange factor GrpE [Chloroflexota bacterium]
MSDATQQDNAQNETPAADMEMEALDDLGTAKKALKEAIQERHAAQEALQAATQLANENLAGWHSANKTIDELKKEIERQKKSGETLKQRSQLAAAQKLEALIYAVDEFLSASPTPPDDIRHHDWVTGVRMLQGKLEAALASHIDADTIVIKLDAKAALTFDELVDKVAAAKLEDETFSLAVEAIDPAPGEPFDGKLHQAIGIDSSGANESGTVAQTLRRGYRVGDFVLREALVMVAG